MGSESQALCGPFSECDLPDYQAAVQAFRSWSYFLPQNVADFVHCVIDRTARFGRRYAYIHPTWFSNGHDPRAKNGYAGCIPMRPIGDRALRKVREQAVALGILRVNRHHVYTVNYSITPLDLVKREEVVKSVISANRRTTELSTRDGVFKFAIALTERLIRAVRDITNAGTYTFRYKTHVISSSDKSSEETRAREKYMGKLEQLQQSIAATVSKKRGRVEAKRRKRLSLADQVSLFEQAWMRGQKDRGIPPMRIVPRHRKLLKDQIIKPASGYDIDFEDMARWVAENWNAIGAQWFTRAKSYPDHPAIGYFIAAYDTFLTAYNDKDNLDPSQTYSTKELRQRAKEAGRADEMVEAERRRALAAQSELRKAKQEIARLRAQSIPTTVPKKGAIHFSEDDWVDPPKKGKRRVRQRR